MWKNQQKGTIRERENKRREENRWRKAVASIRYKTGNNVSGVCERTMKMEAN